MIIVQTQKNSYVDVIRRDVKFDVNDWVYLKISHISSVIGLVKRGKLVPVM